MRSLYARITSYNVCYTKLLRIAANNYYTELLVGLGVTELSMPAINVPTVKERIRSINYSHAVDFADYILSLDTLDDVLKAFEEKNRL